MQGGAAGGPSPGPNVTVFVGNITERAPDILIRQMLNSCGQVNAWKRVQGASGKLQAFGFCEYSNPDSGLRAIRLLHDFPLGEKTLVVKVDAKTKNIMCRFKGSKKRELRGEEAALPAPEGAEEEDTPDAEYMSDEMKQQDEAVSKLRRKLLVSFGQSCKTDESCISGQSEVVTVANGIQSTHGKLPTCASEGNSTQTGRGRHREWPWDAADSAGV